MSDDVGRGAVTSASRPYRSALRDEQSRATRRHIVDAACELFVERGYVPTTIDAIAERAGVGRKTVFTSAGGKSTLLKLGFDWNLAGDDEPVAIADRPHMQHIRQRTDPATLLAEWITMNAHIARRIAPLHHVLIVAADADADAAILLATTDIQRAEGTGLVVERLSAIGGLRRGLEHTQAEAIADALIDPGTYRRLVHIRHQSFEQYLDYQHRIAAAALLRPEHRLATRTRPSFGGSRQSDR